MKLFSIVLFLPILIAGLYTAIDSWLAHKTYILDGTTVASITRDVLHDPQYHTVDAMFDAASARILAKIEATGAVGLHDAPWFFINAGGWMGSFKVLYASLSEYVLLFGTAMPTSGHSGRYWAHIEDTLISGNFTQWIEGGTQAKHWGAGDTVAHPKWAATGVAWGADTWMVEYARGAIATTMPFALGDGMLSSQDWYTVARVLVLYARVVLANAIRGIF